MRKSHFWLAVLAAMGLLEFIFCSSVCAQSIPWRFDYNAARQEARAKNVPLLLDFGSQNCFWCVKLDQTTFRDPQVTRILAEQFIPVKLKAEQNMRVVQALGIQSFPTLIYATPTGHIMGRQEGYVDGQKMTVQLQDVLKQVRQANYVTPAAEKPTPAVSQVSAATDANAVVDPDAAKRTQAARNLLLEAQRDFETQNLICCMERCRTLAAKYADLPEAEQGRQLLQKITTDPKQVLNICEKLTETLGELYLEVARSWLDNNQPEQAIPYLQWVSQACPGTRHAEAAAAELKRIKEPRNNNLPDWH